VIALLLVALASPDAVARSEIEDFAAWCGKQGLRGFRDRAFQALLLFDADHEQARKTLKYRWKDGRWVRKSYKRPTDPDGPRLDAARERWRVITHKYADAVLNDPAARARALQLAPDHAAAREANGEVRRGDAWILAETPRAKQRTREIDALREKTLDRVRAPAEGPVTEEDKKLGVDFPTAWVAPSWRALGTVDPAECKELLKLCEASSPFLNGVFGLRAAAPRGFTLYVLGDDPARAIAKHPAFTPAGRKFALSLEGCWIPGAFSFVAWSDEPRWRRDVVTRAVFGLYLKHRFGLTVKQGWAWEGFGSYLTYQLAGTRLATTASRGPYAQDRKTREEQKRGVEFQKTDWPALARKRFEAKRKPDLRLLAGKDVNTMTADDALVSYAMAEYLVTGFPDKCAGFLKAYGSGISIDEAMKAHLGFDFHAFERRFVRWLEER